MRRETAVALVIALSLPAVAAPAQTHLARPIRVIIGFPPGGGIDIVARVMAPRLTESLGQPIVIDNRPGAGGLIGTDLAAKAAPDGHTVFFGTIGNLSVNPLLYSRLSFDMARDFAPVTHVASVSSALLVHPAFPVKTVPDLIAVARSKPGQINFYSSGIGGTPHLAAELFNLMAGVKLTHVPYQGSAPGLVAITGGHVQVTFGALLSGLPLIKSGRLRGIATLGKARSALLPDLPTVADTLPGYEVINWYGMVVPKATPRPVIARLQGEVAKVLRLPEVRDNLVAQGAEPVGSTPGEFAAFMKTDMARWEKVIKEAGIGIKN
ncbi:MAG: tripartite tricarboxylate transporter substrate binding protein [Betaproteobacteria bacterium]|nr:tripartite tricarboxylate transporter substrate binding protein [Betaproteobacteria bacterium]